MNTRVTIDGNEAVARVAHRLSEVIAIYPITPSTGMAELSDAWSAAAQSNLWGTVPTVIEMQSEGGAAGAVHGSLQTGALATTFTASQGLLLMIPNMYKIAGELTPVVFHVAARALAAQGLSIFGDHSDVMAVRGTGFALLSSGNVQEAHDLALVAHATTLKTRIPFLHFFDGFRTSHEENVIELLSDDDLRALIDQTKVQEHRARALSPERPVLRGTAQNPDVYFQARESVNPFYATCPDEVQAMFDRLAERTGRPYKLFEYHGAPDAERVIVIMGSGAETVRETVAHLQERGEKVGVVTVRLFRPFSVRHLLGALPASVQAMAVLDRCKEPGSAGEPLYLDVVSALREWEAAQPDATQPRVIGGRYGLSSKEFTPAMVLAIFDELRREQPRRVFTVGIQDDVSHLSLAYDPSFSIEAEDTARCVFWGLGADGTVGANKDSIKIIGEQEGTYAQGYFVYDSKKSGSVTTSYLRFGPRPIRAPYLIERASFVACHQFQFVYQYDMLGHAAPSSTFLLNSPYGPDEVWDKLPASVQQALLDKGMRLFVINATLVAKATGMAGRINRIMQTCFFALGSGMPRERALAAIKASIAKTYGKRGPAVVEKNWVAVDSTLEQLHEVDLAGRSVSPTALPLRPAVTPGAPAFVEDVLGGMIAGRGDLLPVSALPFDGTYPTGTAKYEKRNLALEIPVWESELCIQCGKCSFVCPHAVIRQKVYSPADLQNAPEGFKSVPAKFKEFPDQLYTLQVSPEDCTGCRLCVEACPVKDKRAVGRKAINMAPQPPLREQEALNWDYFVGLPDLDRTALSTNTIKNSQLMLPMFEFSGACSGCGETPYIKLATQLFGERMIVANATGCSSIYGGNLPTTPWTTGADGRGPAWANSLFEDNAEFGLGMRVTLDKQEEYARELLPRLAPLIGETLVADLLNAEQLTTQGLAEQRARVDLLRERLSAYLSEHPDTEQAASVRELHSVADALHRKSVWIIGGDGWAYDIGFGGLDHVLASGRDVNILVMDTEVYSNTGGQSSKATPIGAVAKFAANGKAARQKDLGLLAMAYGNVYVARVAMGSSDQQTLNAMREAESYPGPSIILAYSHCIAHGIDMSKGMEQQKLAVQAGAWMLYRYDPRRRAPGEHPLIIDSKAPSLPLESYMYNETRFRMLRQSDEQRAEALLRAAKEEIKDRWTHYQELAEGTI